MKKLARPSFHLKMWAFFANFTGRQDRIEVRVGRNSTLEPWYLWEPCWSTAVLEPLTHFTESHFCSQITGRRDEGQPRTVFQNLDNISFLHVSLAPWQHLPNTRKPGDTSTQALVCVALSSSQKLQNPEASGSRTVIWSNLKTWLGKPVELFAKPIRLDVSSRWGQVLRCHHLTHFRGQVLTRPLILRIRNEHVCPCKANMLVYDLQTHLWSKCQTDHPFRVSYLSLPPSQTNQNSLNCSLYACSWRSCFT